MYRIPGAADNRAGVFALSGEIDAWLTTTGGNGAEVGRRLASAGSRMMWAAALSVPLLLGIATAVLTVATADPPPHLGAAVAITNDGLLKNDLMATGNKLLCSVLRESDGMSLIEMSTAGGAPASVVSNWPMDYILLGVAPGGSRMLAGRHETGCDYALWVVDSASGVPSRLNGLCAGTAAWSPDGRSLAYVTGNRLYLASWDGSRGRLLTAPPPVVDHLRWSPDGKRLRFTQAANPRGFASARLWEVEIAHPVARRVLPGWSRGPRDCEYIGQWSPDGEYFVFAGVHDDHPGLWAIRERRGLFGLLSRNPVRLTTSAEAIEGPTFSADGKRLFAIQEAHQRGEMLRYDTRNQRPELWPGRSPLSAGQVSFSPDGREAAYVTWPEYSLWRMSADGTGRRQLTFGKSCAAMP